ncbi:beta-mannosidase isoform X2 [Cimex lectularius]|nr:beta-mannosidase isoform X2 [Cimex lectularius]
MQASFSWDWGPAFPSVGIWKPVYIELNEGKLLRSVGTFITESPMNWRVTIRFWFDGDYQVTGDLSAKLDIMPGVSYIIQKFNVSVGTEERLVLSVPKNQVKVWWPNGLGKQPLYKLKANFTSNSATITKSIKIAFRTVELSQEPVSMDLSKGEVFYFKVNGVPIFAKGSNWIPSHVLPENLENKKKIYSLLKSSVDANFNMLRVWGGGIYESDYFYSVCDQLGIMIWQDLMFACSMYPSTDDFLNSVKTEVEQNMQRLQHHVSIVLIAGNNENEAALRQDWYGTGSSFKKYKDDYITLYVDSIKPIIEQINPQVTYLTSSPSNGLETEREGYVARNPQNNLYGDVHFYNYYTNLWLADVFPHPRFSSEYGLQSLPAMSTLKKVFDKEDLMWGSNALNERQHLPVGNDILQLQIDQNLPKAFNLSDVIYLSQINQAMAMKTETELYRSLRSVLEPTGAGLTMGALYWQLNDIWEAPSWSSIDFYGNWKMLHYYTRDFFSNVIISPARTAADNLVVSVVSDLTHQLNGTLKIYVYNWDAFEPKNIIKMPIQIDGGMSVKVLDKFLLDILGDYDNFSNSFLIFKMDVIPFVSVPDNFLFPVPPKNSNFPDATVTIKSIYKTTDNTAEITLQTDKIALFVWLESTDEKVNFHFSKNGFHMLLPETVITVMSMEARIEEEALFEQISVRNLKPTYS